eukprot:TRINITY_DN3899_c0_g1_i3.p1 TRINITY_DN3899_c0_g1~~TRINITY_DN3899_c0_g1_i3.p1  ORF type:complete len:103 (+),score=12.94 TRINITY_DN3899_c0_g1_i3:3-311(+)
MSNYEPAQIKPHLYLGSKISASDKQLLIENSISHVVNMTIEIENYFEEDPNFTYLQCNLEDTQQESVVDQFEACFELIDQAKLQGKACLVHCQAGISRFLLL